MSSLGREPAGSGETRPRPGIAGHRPLAGDGASRRPEAVSSPRNREQKTLTSRGAATENVALTPAGGYSVVETHNFENGVGFAQPRLLSEIFDCPPEKGMDPIRGDLGGRFERKTPLMQPRVGELQDGTTAHSRCREEEVEVEGPGPPGFFLRPIAARLRLEFEAVTEQRTRPSRPVDHDGAVEIVGLLWTDRSGPPQTRCGNDCPLGGQAFDTARKREFRIAEIAAKTEKYSHHHSDHS